MARLTGGGLTGAAHLYAVVHGEAEQGHDDAEQCQKDPVLADARETVAPQEGDDAQQPRTPLCPCPRCQNYDRFFFRCSQSDSTSNPKTGILRQTYEGTVC